MSNSDNVNGLLGIIMGVIMMALAIFSTYKNLNVTTEERRAIYRSLSYDTAVFIQVFPQTTKYYVPSKPEKVKKFTVHNMDKSILSFVEKASVGDTFIKVAGIDEFFLLKQDSIVIHRGGVVDSLKFEIIIRK